MPIAPSLPDIDALLQEIVQEKARPQRAWRVILYNDHVHKLEDVVLWIQKATGCSLQVAEQITITAHRTGRAIAYEGEKDRCSRVAGYLRGQGLQVEVDDAPGS